MKLIKMFGLALISTIAVVAFVGGPSASADWLCLDSTVAETCPEAKRAANGTAFTAELKEGEAILTGALEVKCKKSTFSGKITVNGGSTVHALIEALTLTECTNCTEMIAKQFHEESQWGVQIDWKNITAGVQNDVFTITHPVILMQKCPLGIQCVFTSEEMILDLSSTGAAQTIKAINEKINLNLCGTGTFNATYKLTAPLPSFVSLK